MRIEKVYNNNVVLAKGDEGEEIIVMGRGLGFQKKSGDEIDTSLVEKTFVMQDSSATNELTRVYIDLSPAETEVVLVIIKQGQEVLGLILIQLFILPLQIICITHFSEVVKTSLCKILCLGRFINFFQRSISLVVMPLRLFLKYSA